MSRLLVVAALVALCGGCVDAAPDPLDGVVRGALRSSVDYLVAPPGYASGVLRPGLAAEWLARGESEVRQWYRGASLAQQLLGLRNVVEAHTTAAAPIAVSVDFRQVEFGTTSVDSDHARVDQGTITYVTHYAPGTWDPVDVPGVSMCQLELSRANGEWRVDEMACNVSGG
jgi:hypothetical protein